MVETSALDSEATQPAVKSKAARFNAHMLKRLQAALSKDPEVNLAEKFPADYSTRLMEMKALTESSPGITS